MAVITSLAVACGTSGPSGSSSAEPTPVLPPDPHLHEPVTADQTYTLIQSAKLGMTCTNAILGNNGAALVKQINCTIDGWPLRILQYTTSGVLDKTVGWSHDKAPGGD